VLYCDHEGARTDRSEGALPPRGGEKGRSDGSADSKTSQPEDRFLLPGFEQLDRIMAVEPIDQPLGGRLGGIASVHSDREQQALDGHRDGDRLPFAPLCEERQDRGPGIAADEPEAMARITSVSGAARARRWLLSWLRTNSKESGTSPYCEAVVG